MMQNAGLLSRPLKGSHQQTAHSPSCMPARRIACIGQVLDDYGFEMHRVNSRLMASGELGSQCDSRRLDCCVSRFCSCGALWPQKTLTRSGHHFLCVCLCVRALLPKQLLQKKRAMVAYPNPNICRTGWP